MNDKIVTRASALEKICIPTDIYLILILTFPAHVNLFILFVLVYYSGVGVINVGTVITTDKGIRKL